MRRLNLSLTLVTLFVLAANSSVFSRFIPSFASPLFASAQPATRPATAPATRPASVVAKDIDGNDCHPFDAGNGKAAVVIFLSHDCPISNSYAPEIGRLYEAYANAGFRFSIVHPYVELSAADAKKHAIEFRLPGTVIVSDTLAPVVEAKVTPEVAVVGPDGTILYRGRIDDKWAGYAKSRVEPNTRELRDALDAIGAGKPV